MIKSYQDKSRSPRYRDLPLSGKKIGIKRRCIFIIYRINYDISYRIIDIFKRCLPLSRVLCSPTLIEVKIFGYRVIASINQEPQKNVKRSWECVIYHIKEESLNINMKRVQLLFHLEIKLREFEVKSLIQ